MTGPTRRRRRSALAGLAGAVGVAGLGLAACGAPTAHPDRPAAAPAGPSLPVPLATSVATPDGTWAVVPMGRLDQRSNTFWQLLHLPRAGGRWSNQVEATATATNGGLVLASAGSLLLVGIRPSTRLRFTPLIATTDAGRHWTNGLIDSGLQADPTALAVTGAPTGATRAVALVDRPGAQELLTTGGTLSTWRRLTTVKTLAASPADRACELSRLAAVGYFGSRWPPPPAAFGSSGPPGAPAGPPSPARRPGPRRSPSPPPASSTPSAARAAG